MSFNLVGGRIGAHVRDPAFMPRWYLTNSTYVIRSYSASTVDMTNALFWTGGVASVDRIPGTVYTTSSFTAGTWKTIASVTGSGLISDVIGPNHQGGGGPAGSTEFRFTLDGVLYSTISITHTAVAQRSMLGFGLPLDAYHAASQYGFQAVSTVTGYAVEINSAGGYVLLGPLDPRLPTLLYFASSLLVEIRTVGQNSAGSLPGDYSGVVMRRFT